MGHRYMARMLDDARRNYSALICIVYHFCVGDGDEGDSVSDDQQYTKDKHHRIYVRHPKNANEGEREEKKTSNKMKLAHCE